MHGLALTVSPDDYRWPLPGSDARISTERIAIIWNVALLFTIIVSASPAALIPVLPPQPIAKVWAGQHVAFGMIVANGRLVVGYYDGNRKLVIASRPTRGGPWQRQVLPTVVGWDSHNMISLAADAAGRIHVAANMHSSPMVFFSTEAGGSLETFRRIPVLVDGRREQSVTYPTFLKDVDGRLIFRYRSGMSGSGEDIYNVLDVKTNRWRRLMPSALLDGKGHSSAYASVPTMGPDKRFHMVGVWRDTPAAETNHDLFYARSADLVHWETSGGKPLSLPITPSTSEIVDPVPSGGGIINVNVPFGFDNSRRVMIAYHKFDAHGDTQVYLARRETRGWRIVQASAWSGYRWNFRGRGSIPREVKVLAPFQRGDAIVISAWRQGKAARFLLSADTLRTLPTNYRLVPANVGPRWPKLKAPSGMVMQGLSASGEGRAFHLAWATLPGNRDRPREMAPVPSDLWLVERAVP